MKVRKAIKKVAALGTGLSMLGATFFGATAADLSDYPSPLFVKDGIFNGIIVVGDNAASSDVIGAVDIATHLQYASKTETVVETEGSSATTVVTGDATMIAQGSDPLNYRQILSGPVSDLTDDDLQSLASGVVNNQQGAFKYNQFIELSDHASVYFYEDDDISDDGALYLNFPDNTVVYTYSLTFPTSLESDLDELNNGNYELDDLEGKKITLLGNEYNVLKAEIKDDDLTLELMRGAVTDTLEEYTSKIYTLNGVDYEVEVVAIGVSGSDNTENVILKINGEVTDKLEEGDTYTTNDGTEVGIETILENEGSEGGGDIVEFNLGAQKISLVDSNINDDTFTNDVEVGDDEVDAKVNIKATNTSSSIDISEIEIQWTADDDYSVPMGEKLSDQLDDDEKGNLFLENIDFEFAGADFGDREEIQIKPSGDMLDIHLETKTGGEFSFHAFATTNDAMVLGEEVGKEIVVNSSKPVGNNDFVVLSEGKFSFVIQVDDFDEGDNQVTFHNVATGDDTVKEAGSCDGTDESELILDGKSFTFMADCSSEQVWFTSSDGFGSDYDDLPADMQDKAVIMYTKGEAKIVFYENMTNDGIGQIEFFEEEKDDYNDADYDDGLNITVQEDESDDEIEVKSSAIAKIDGSGNNMIDSDDFDSKDDFEVGYTTFGTMYELDYDEPGNLKLYYPSEEAEFQVYVTSGVTKTNTIAGSSGDALTTTDVTPIEVGAAKLASEVSNIRSQHMIVVGGPCANTVAAELMGNPSPCGKDFEENKAIIKLYENGNNVAMLVAGYEAIDTRRASRVLAEPSSYSLSGKELEVRGTSTTFSDTVVSAVTHDMMDDKEEMMDDDMAEDDMQ